MTTDYAPTKEQEEAIREYLHESIVPLIEQVLVKKLGQAMCYAAQELVKPKRESLTLEQLREHWQVAKVLDMTDAEIDFADYVLIARDIEALYGIKENK